MELTERNLVGRVSKIVVFSSAVSRFSAHEDKLSLILNACDSDNLPPALPKSIQPPVYGYVGTIGHWFDWEAVVSLASSLRISDPQARVRLIGPVLLHRSSAESLTQFRANNSWQTRFAGLISLFDAGIDQRGRRRSTAKLEHFSWQGA